MKAVSSDTTTLQARLNPVAGDRPKFRRQVDGSIDYHVEAGECGAAIDDHCYATEGEQARAPRLTSASRQWALGCWLRESGQLAAGKSIEDLAGTIITLPAKRRLSSLFLRYSLEA